MRRAIPVDVKPEAVFHGPNNEFRPLLKRTWSPDLPILATCMLNPSTADVDSDDPTVAGMCVRARLLGFGALWVVNAHDFRATDPRDMKRAAVSCSGVNDWYIRRTLEACSMFICAWGTHAGERGQQLREWLSYRDEVHKVHYLRLTRHGHPEHPLYIPYEVKPVRWSPEDMRKETHAGK